MGKIKRQRKKLHLSNVPEANVTSNATSSWSDSVTCGISKSNFPLQAFDNVFAGIDIPMNNMSLQDDARTVVSSSKSVFKMDVKKKAERREIRHQTFIEKINAIQAMKSTEKSKKGMKNIQTTAIPSTSNYVRPRESEKPKKMKKKGVAKSTMRHRQMLRDIAAIKKVWNKPTFKADPIGTISDSVRENISKEIA